MYKDLEFVNFHIDSAICIVTILKSAETLKPIEVSRNIFIFISMSKFGNSCQVRQSVRHNCDPRLSGKNVTEWAAWCHRHPAAVLYCTVLYCTVLHGVTLTPAAAPLLMLLNSAKTKPHRSANYSSINPLSLSICPFGWDCSTKF